MPSFANAVKAGQAYISITMDNASLVKGISDVSRHMKTFGAFVQSMGSDIMRFSLITSGSVAAAMNSYIKFDDEMLKTAAISGSAKAEMEKLRETARGLGATTAFSAQQVAEGMTAASRMGAKFDELNTSMQNYLYLTRATGNEVFRLAEVMTISKSIANQYGIKLDETAHLNDVLAFAANNSANSIQDIGEASKSIGPIASKYETVEDTIANIMALGNVGVRGSLLGTALRKAYSEFAKQASGNLQEGDIDLEKDYGIPTRISDRQMRKPIDILADMFKKSKSMSNAEATSFFENVLGLRGQLAGVKLSENAQEVKKFRSDLNFGTGYAKKTHDEMESKVGGTMRVTLSRIQEVALAVGESLENAFSGLLNLVSEISIRISSFISNNRELVNTIVMVSAVATSLGAVIMGLGLGIKVAAYAVSGLGVGLKVLLSPFAALKAIIIGINAVGIAAVSIANALYASTVMKYTSVKIATGLLVAYKTSLYSAIGAMTVAKYAIKILSLSLTGLNVLIKLSPALFMSMKTAIMSSFVAMKSLVMASKSMKVAISIMASFKAGVSSAFAVLSSLKPANDILFATIEALFALMRGVGKTVVMSITHGLASLASFGLIPVEIATKKAWSALIAFSSSVYHASKSSIMLLATSFRRVAINAWNFVRTISLAKAASISYHRVIKMLHAGVSVLQGGIDGLKKSLESIKNFKIGNLVRFIKPLLVIAAAVAAVYAAFKLCQRYFKPLKDLLVSGMNKITSIFKSILPVIIEFGKALWEAFNNGDFVGMMELSVNAVKAMFFSLGDSIIAKFVDVYGFLVDKWYVASEHLFRGILWITDKIGATDFVFGNNFRSDLDEYFREVREKSKNELKAMRQNTSDYFKSGKDESMTKYRESIDFIRKFKSVQDEISKYDSMVNSAGEYYRQNYLLNGWESFKGSLDDASTNIDKSLQDQKMKLADRNRVFSAIKSRIAFHEKQADEYRKSYDDFKQSAMRDRVIDDSEKDTLEKYVMVIGKNIHFSESLREKLSNIDSYLGNDINRVKVESGQRTSNSKTIDSTFFGRLYRFQNFDLTESTNEKILDSVKKIETHTKNTEDDTEDLYAYLKNNYATVIA